MIASSAASRGATRAAQATIGIEGMKLSSLALSDSGGMAVGGSRESTLGLTGRAVGLNYRDNRGNLRTTFAVDGIQPCIKQ